jgi:hypothetical protein
MVGASVGAGTVEALGDALAVAAGELVAAAGAGAGGVAPVDSPPPPQPAKAAMARASHPVVKVQRACRFMQATLEAKSAPRLVQTKRRSTPYALALISSRMRRWPLMQSVVPPTRWCVTDSRSVAHSRRVGERSRPYRCMTLVRKSLSD